MRKTKTLLACLKNKGDTSMQGFFVETAQIRTNEALVLFSKQPVFICCCTKGLDKEGLDVKNVCQFSTPTPKSNFNTF